MQRVCIAQSVYVRTQGGAGHGSSRVQEFCLSRSLFLLYGDHVCGPNVCACRLGLATDQRLKLRQLLDVLPLSVTGMGKSYLPPLCAEGSGGVCLRCMLPLCAEGSRVVSAQLAPSCVRGP